jgi:hypothetical protein
MPTSMRSVTVARLGASALVLIALGLTLTDTSGLVPERLIDLLSYYTLQANFLALAVWVASAIAATRPTSARIGTALEYGRAFAAANLMLVAIIYWSMIAPLGLEAGPRLVIVMVISHIMTPLYATVDYLVVGNAKPLPLRGWWWFFAIPTAWIAAAVARAYSGGWVPYDYLDPARGMRAIALTVSWHGVLLAILTIVVLRVRTWRSVPHAWPSQGLPDAPVPLDASPLDGDRAVA